MGLAERRAVENFKTSQFEDYCKQTQEICGFKLEINCDWAAIEKHEQCIYIFDNKKIQEYFFGNFNTALKNICQDAMGKKSFKDTVKKVNFVNKSGDLKIEKGVFTIYSSLDGNGIWGANEIQEFLEKNL